MFPAILFHLRRSDLVDHWDIDAITDEQLEPVAAQLRSWINQNFWDLVQKPETLQLDFPERLEITTKHLVEALPSERLEIQHNSQVVNGERVYYIASLRLATDDLRNLGLNVSRMSIEAQERAAREIGAAMLCGDGLAQTELEYWYSEREDDILRDVVGQHRWHTIVRIDEIILSRFGFARFRSDLTPMPCDREANVRDWIIAQLSDPLRDYMGENERIATQGDIREWLRQALRVEYGKSCLDATGFGRMKADVKTTAARLSTERQFRNLGWEFLLLKATRSGIAFKSYQGPDYEKETNLRSEDNSAHAVPRKRHRLPNGRVSKAVFELIENLARPIKAKAVHLMLTAQVEFSDVSKRTVSAALQDLVSRQLIQKTRGYRRSTWYGPIPSAHAVSRKRHDSPRAHVANAVLKLVESFVRPINAKEAHLMLTAQVEFAGVSKGAVSVSLQDLVSRQLIQTTTGDSRSVWYGPSESHAVPRKTT